MSQTLFTGKTFTVRRNILSILGAAIKVFDENGEQILFSKQAILKLKEDIRIYTDETKTQEVFRIKARNVIDFSAAYDVIDSQTNSKIGALKRKGLKSLIRDEWLILDIDDNEVGLIKEDSATMAILRRFLSNLIPQSFHVSKGGKQIATFKRAFNPFVTKIAVDFSADTEGHFDHRIGLAAVLLIAVIEDRG
jgi:hypothetical protein